VTGRSLFSVKVEEPGFFDGAEPVFRDWGAVCFP